MSQASRLGDPTSCCITLTASPTTFADHIPISRVLADVDCCDCIPASPAAIIAGALTTWADHFLWGHVGGADACPATSTIVASPTTFAT